MDDQRRIHYVTGHYAHLQGLRLLPLSAPFLMAAVERAAGRPLLPGGLWPLLLVASVVAPFPIGRYYERTYGRAPAQRWQSGLLTLVASCGGFLWFEWLQETLMPPVSLPILFVAVLLARLGLVAGRLRGHYLWIAAAVTLFGLLPEAGMANGTRAIVGYLLVGGGLAVAAIGDDRVLRRSLTHHNDDPIRSAA